MKTTSREVPFPDHNDEHQVIDLILQEQLQLEEALLPQKVLVGVLDLYNQEEAQNMLEMCWLGQLGQDCCSQLFHTCINLRLKDSTLKMMLTMVNFCQKHNKFSEQLYVFKNNLCRLLIFLMYFGGN